MCSIFPFQNDLLAGAVVSVFKNSSIKFKYYFYKFKEFSRKKSFSRSFQGPSSFSRSIPGPCEPCMIFGKIGNLTDHSHQKLAIIMIILK